jgi:transposase
MLQPVRRKTWAPRGHTPLQHAWDRHDRLSVLSAITVSALQRRLRLYFAIHTENIRTPHVVSFLGQLHRQLHRHLRRPCLLVWDRWNVHRSASRWFEDRHPDWFEFEWLPAYAPELNPVEQVWNHAKYARLANTSLTTCSTSTSKSTSHSMTIGRTRASSAAASVTQNSPCDIRL